MPATDRRRFLHAIALTGLGGLAGCTGSTAVTERGPGAENTPTVTDHATDRQEDSSLDDWLLSANDAQPVQVRDRRFDDPPTVHLGVSGARAFSPPAIMVTPGTTVTWEWIGKSGEHNVVATDGTFDSGEPVADGGTTFSHTFDAEGTYRYVSEPHADAGMRGVVVVKPVPRSGYPTVDEWLAGVDAYDGSVTDRTGADPVEVTMGAEGNGGHFAVDPLAVKVSTGTTVEWSWSGHGGAHTVTFADADFGIEDPRSEPGVNFTHTFTERGVYRYSCLPHRAIGERGAVIVE